MPARVDDAALDAIRDARAGVDAAVLAGTSIRSASIRAIGDGTPGTIHLRLPRPRPPSEDGRAVG